MLAALGACLASAGNGSDPSTLVVSTFGVTAVPVLLLLIHGPIATNILNLYSCSLAALSLGVRAARWKVTLIAGLSGSPDALDKLASDLKRLCGTGGTLRGDTIEIQGEFRERLKTELEKRGYTVKIAGG